MQANHSEHKCMQLDATVVSGEYCKLTQVLNLHIKTAPPFGQDFNLIQNNNN